MTNMASSNFFSALFISVVVAKLTLASTAAVSHNLYANIIKAINAMEAPAMGIEMTGIVLNFVVIGLSILFENLNIVFIIRLVFSIYH